VLLSIPIRKKLRASFLLRICLVPVVGQGEERFTPLGQGGCRRIVTPAGLHPSPPGPRPAQNASPQRRRRRSGGDVERVHAVPVLPRVGADMPGLSGAQASALVSNWNTLFYFPAGTAEACGRLSSP
jgi:hypothetical protein